MALERVAVVLPDCREQEPHYLQQQQKRKKLPSMILCKINISRFGLGLVYLTVPEQLLLVLNPFPELVVQQQSGDDGVCMGDGLL
jgi:hypothetical protein